MVPSKTQIPSKSWKIHNLRSEFANIEEFTVINLSNLANVVAYQIVRVYLAPRIRKQTWKMILDVIIAYSVMFDFLYRITRPLIREFRFMIRKSGFSLSLIPWSYSTPRSFRKLWKKRKGGKKGKIKIIIMKSTLVYGVSSKICPTKKQSIVGISALIKLVHGETR